MHAYTHTHAHRHDAHTLAHSYFAWPNHTYASTRSRCLSHRLHTHAQTLAFASHTGTHTATQLPYEGSITVHTDPIVFYPIGWVVTLVSPFGD